MGFKGSWFLFIFMILGGRYLIGFMGIDDTSAWGVTHKHHAQVSFFMMHWMKGTPLDSTWTNVTSQGRFDKLTWWEQLDMGQGWSDNKKFLAFLPVFTFIMAVRPIELKDNLVIATAHTCIFGFGLVPKLPSFHQVRLFGVNAD